MQVKDFSKAELIVNGAFDWALDDCNEIMGWCRITGGHSEFEAAQGRKSLLVAIKEQLEWSETIHLGLQNLSSCQLRVVQNVLQAELERLGGERHRVCVDVLGYVAELLEKGGEV